MVSRRNIPIEGKCIFCGDKTLDYSVAARKKYCSAKCRNKANHSKHYVKVKIATPRHFICVVCGAPSLDYSKNKNGKYCSIKCNKKLSRIKNRDKIRQYQTNVRRAKGIGITRQKSCEVCNKSFFSNSNIQKYCSAKCGRRISRERLLVKHPDYNRLRAVKNYKAAKEKTPNYGKERYKILKERNPDYCKEHYKALIKRRPDYNKERYNLMIKNNPNFCKDQYKSRKEKDPNHYKTEKAVISRKKRCSELSEGYIKARLRAHGVNQPTPEIINLKKIHLKLKRIKHERKNEQPVNP